MAKQFDADQPGLVGVAQRPMSRTAVQRAVDDLRKEEAELEPENEGKKLRARPTWEISKFDLQPSVRVQADVAEVTDSGVALFLDEAEDGTAMLVKARNSRAWMGIDRVDG
jgi:hypothetical protein